MAVASPALANRPLRDDIMNPRSSPMASTGYAPRGMMDIDKDAETMARESRPALLQPLEGGEPEETTRAVSREELMRHQDAHVIVGEDAIGDEATLAIAPGQVDLGIEGGIAAALQETLQKRESQPQFPAAPPQFHNNMQPPGAGPMGAPMGSSGHLPAAQPFGHGPSQGGMGMPQQPQSWGEAPQGWPGEAAQSYRNPPQMGMPPGFDPMLPQGPQSNPGMPGQFAQSGQHPLMHGQGGFAPGMGQGGYGPNANAATAQQQRPMGPMPGQAPPWAMQPSPPTGATGPTKFTPQVILLVAVGAVCLAIFIIGIVLFVTTKF
jgi:hypothetical protein